MGFLERIFGGKKERARLRPLYDAIVAAGRDGDWYREGQVPDTIDGRFDMITAILALVLLRLEQEGERLRPDTILLTELFIDDMDGTLRQIGIGDFVVGKHIGRMMGSLGGRLGAFRAAAAPGGDFGAAVRKNVFHDSPPSEEAVALVSARLVAFAEGLAAIPAERLVAGEIPKP